METKSKLTREDAAAAIRAGQTVKMTMGEDPEDPVLLLRVEDGMVMQEVIAGWSQGICEPVCEEGSDFLETCHLRGELEIVPLLWKDVKPGQRLPNGRVVATNVAACTWTHGDAGRILTYVGEPGLETQAHGDLPVPVAS